jgi:vitamin B12 transporter
VGTPTWETLALDSIDHIEIVRGPLSGLYGSDAVGGVVQVFTRGGVQGSRAHGSASVGSQRAGQLSAGLQFGQGDLDGAVQVSHHELRGGSASNAKVPFGSFNPDDDGFRQNSATARLGWRFASGWRADLNALRSDGESQFDDGPGADARMGLRAKVLGLQVAGSLMPAWRTTLRLSRSVDDSETLASASPFSTLGTITSDQKVLAWENSLSTPMGTALLLAERLQQEVSRPGAPFAVSARTVHALASGLNGSAGVHSWQASLRHDRNSQYGHQTTGNAAYGLEVVPGLRAGAAWGTSFVAPSFNQLYFPNFGNPDLLPEKGTHRELSLRWQAAAATVRLAWFDNRIRGYISSGPLPVNVPFARVEGVSASLDAALGAWSLSASIDSMNPVNDTAGSSNFGKLLPRRVQDSARTALDWHGGAVVLGATLAAHGARFDDAANSTRVGGYVTVDLRADWQITKSWVLGLRVSNAGDKVYETVYGYNQPGRDVRLILRYSGT